MKKFPRVQGNDRSRDLPPLKMIQHQIDLILLRANFPNLAYYQMSPEEIEALQAIVNELLTKKLIRTSMSPCAVPEMFVPKKDGSS